MKFSELKYERPDLPAIKQKVDAFLKQFNACASAEEQIKVIEEIYKLRSSFDTMGNVASIRHTIDTTDKFYEAEQDFYDDAYPNYLDLVTEFYRTLLQSKFRGALELKFGKQLFRIAEMTLKTFSPEIIGDLQRENELSTEYIKLVASAEIEFRGNKYNLSGMIPFKQSTDRATRIEAHERSDAFFITNAKILDRIFDDMVKVRTTIAQKLGFKSFIPVGYLRMLRSDYDAEMVKKFRREVEVQIVPLVLQLKERQRRRLGLDTLYYYDEALDFTSGNPIPKGEPEWIINQAEKMYNELSGQTGEFFRYMRDNDLMDLVNRPNKATGGYCTFLSDLRSPFIFSNFNGTSGDIDVLTHEAGHAFQSYCSRHLDLEEYFFPTSEAAEIHSMSMEFITWPWMHLFFNSQTAKYQFTHLSHSLSFLPYGVAVDEFQHIVYENPSLTPAERNKAWADLEKKYLPHRNYASNPFLESGGFWQRQAHIYKHPFYYIDYTLAQICAFQFWKKSSEDMKAAMADYIRLCKEGGSKSFLELVKVANLQSPFDSKTFEQVTSAVENWLTTVDDMKLN